MSFDIYGNNLRRGHCEVHPHIHEEYPCTICMQDSQRRANQRDEQAEYEREMNRQYEAHIEEQLFNEGAYYAA